MYYYLIISPRVKYLASSYSLLNELNLPSNFKSMYVIAYILVLTATQTNI